MPRPIVVAIAAPVTPSSGNGPRPKISSGPSTMLMTLASQSTRIAIAASPAPRKIALIRNSSDDGDAAAEHDRGVAAPVAIDRRRRAHEREQLRREQRARRRRPPRDTTSAERDRLHGGARGALRVLLADAARHRGRRADAEPHGEGVDQRQHRLGEPDRRDGVGAEARHPEDVGDREDDSMTISSTIGTASSSIARPIGPSVKS